MVVLLTLTTCTLPPLRLSFVKIDFEIEES